MHNLFKYYFVSFLLLASNILSAQERVTFYVNDAFGTPVVALDASGGVIWAGDYDPFGKLISSTGTMSTNRQWRAAFADAESNLLLMGKRYYHPSLGRFLSPDPAIIGNLPIQTVALPARLNAYTYALNNPYRFEDPTGAYAIESESLKRSKEFQAATRLVAHTKEGARILWALDFANASIAIFDEKHPANAAFRETPLGHRVVAGEMWSLQSADWDHMVLIDYSIIKNIPGRRRRIQIMAHVLYHELRHVENHAENLPFDRETSKKVDEALDKYAHPSLDYRERVFLNQLKRLMQSPGRSRP